MEHSTDAAPKGRGVVGAARGLLSNAAIWTAFGVTTLADAPGGGAPQAVIWAIGALMRANAPAFLAPGSLLDRYRWAAPLAAALVAVNVRLAFTDQVALSNPATLAIDLALLRRRAGTNAGTASAKDAEYQ